MLSPNMLRLLRYHLVVPYVGGAHVKQSHIYNCMQTMGGFRAENLPTIVAISIA